MLDIINEIKTHLETLVSFKSVRIGIERGISVKDVPFIRISPSTYTNDSQRSDVEYIVYVGIKKEANAQDNFIDVVTLTNEVIECLNRIEIQSGLNTFESAQFDDDRLDNLKVVALRFKTQGCM